MRTAPSTSQNSSADSSGIRLVSATGTTKNRPTASASPAKTANAHVAREIGGSSSRSCALAARPSARTPIRSDCTSATKPRTTGSRSSGLRRVQAANGNDCTATSPSRRRTATAQVETPRIITPSSTA